jgi:hypothetical protein
VCVCVYRCGGHGAQPNGPEMRIEGKEGKVSEARLKKDCCISTAVKLVSRSFFTAYIFICRPGLPLCHMGGEKRTSFESNYSFTVFCTCSRL